MFTSRKQVIILILAGLLSVSTAFAAPLNDTIETTDVVVTQSGYYNTSPTLGADEYGETVVYTSYEELPGGDYGPGEIRAQRLNDDGTADGPVIQVSNGSTDDRYSDISGSFIVYTAYELELSQAGKIMVFDLDTRNTVEVTSQTVTLFEVHIHGSSIVWSQGTENGYVIMFYDLDWDTGNPITLSSPQLYEIRGLDIGARYVVWGQHVNGQYTGQYEIKGYDYLLGIPVSISADPDVSEEYPTTDGSTIVWQATDIYGSMTIEIADMGVVPIDRYTAVDNGSDVMNPSIHGDLVSYDGLSATGDWDIYLYRISDGASFNLTDRSGNQWLSSIYGNKVAYVNESDINRNIHVSTFSFVPTNLFPFANAGPDQTVHAGTTVDLDGSASYDPEVGSLSYVWEFAGKPTGSTIALTNADSANPSFIADQVGDYTIKLVVTDDGGLSSEDYVIVSAANVTPIADAGNDQAVYLLDTLVQLDGSQSWDEDGDEITYIWTMITPMGSIAVLSDPTLVNPTFVADIYGTYEITLMVSDPWVSSASDQVTVSLDNTAPVADAGPDQAVVMIGSTIQLDGTQSYDLGGDPIAYQWSVISIPTGSAAALSDPTSPTPSFTADLYGIYEFELQVTDPWLSSTPDTVVVSFENVMPVADAGQNQAVSVGDTVQLDGSGSMDANGDPLTYSWSFIDLPESSFSALDDPAAAQASFVADASGTYTIQLIVNDGLLDSEPSEIIIIATTTEDEIVEKLIETIVEINDLNPEVFRNENLQNTLTNKITAVLEMIEDGEIEDALNKLEHDILKKIDGCAENGEPDRNDWIQDCESQDLIYTYIMEVISLLDALQ